ncbi:hypothetical protein D3C76_1450050 [compost metagenome]
MQVKQGIPLPGRRSVHLAPALDMAFHHPQLRPQPRIADEAGADDEEIEHLSAMRRCHGNPSFGRLDVQPRRTEVQNEPRPCRRALEHIGRRRLVRLEEMRDDAVLLRIG